MQKEVGDQPQLIFIFIDKWRQILRGDMHARFKRKGVIEGPFGKKALPFDIDQRAEFFHPFLLQPLRLAGKRETFVFIKVVLDNGL